MSRCDTYGVFTTKKDRIEQFSLLFDQKPASRQGHSAIRHHPTLTFSTGNIFFRFVVKGETYQLMLFLFSTCKGPLTIDMHFLFKVIVCIFVCFCQIICCHVFIKNLGFHCKIYILHYSMLWIPVELFVLM